MDNVKAVEALREAIAGVVQRLGEKDLRIVWAFVRGFGKEK